MQFAVWIVWRKDERATEQNNSQKYKKRKMEEEEVEEAKTQKQRLNAHQAAAGAE